MEAIKPFHYKTITQMDRMCPIIIQTFINETITGS